MGYLDSTAGKNGILLAVEVLGLLAAKGIFEQRPAERSRRCGGGLMQIPLTVDLGILGILLIFRLVLEGRGRKRFMEFGRFVNLKKSCAYPHFAIHFLKSSAT